MDIEKYLQSGKLEQYVLGLSSPEERREVERLAKAHPEIDAYILELHKCMNLCSEANEVPIAEEPPHQSKCKTFHLKSKRNLATEKDHQSRSTVFSATPWGKGVASVVVVGLSFLSFFLYQSKQNAGEKIALLETQLHHLKMDNERLVNESGNLMQQYTVLKDDRTQHVNLKGLDIAPEAHGIVYFNKAHGKAYLSVCNLPKTPADHHLCVWANVNGKHQKVADLSTDNADLLYNISFKKECKGFCITLEKDGADANPTIEKMLVKGEM